MTNIDDDLRAALKAALPDLTEDQAIAASDLLDALTPAMDEPKWPGAPVIAGCDSSGRERLHIRQKDGPYPGWECQYAGWGCQYACTDNAWERLINPRPLTPAEYADYGIPMPCTHTTAEGTA